MASAITILSSFIQTLKPERRDLKRKFYDSVKASHFVGEAATPKVAAMHTANAFRNFASRFELPVGEDDLLMSRLGSICKIGTADLSSLPIYDSTKNKLSQFFGSHHHHHQQQQQLVHGGHPQSRNGQRMMNESSLGIQESYPVQDVYGAMNGAVGPFHNRPYQSSAFQSPLRDSVEGMGDQRFGYSKLDTFQDPPVCNARRATPQLASQQFVPRQQQQQQQQGIPPLANHQSPQNERPRRLLYQFNRNQMGNPIRPMSAYSSESRY